MAKHTHGPNEILKFIGGAIKSAGNALREGPSRNLNKKSGHTANKKKKKKRPAKAGGTAKAAPLKTLKAIASLLRG